jgi:hypothetical protein
VRVVQKPLPYKPSKCIECSHRLYVEASKRKTLVRYTCTNVRHARPCCVPYACCTDAVIRRYSLLHARHQMQLQLPRLSASPIAMHHDTCTGFLPSDPMAILPIATLLTAGTCNRDASGLRKQRAAQPPPGRSSAGTQPSMQPRGLQTLAAHAPGSDASVRSSLHACTVQRAHRRGDCRWTACRVHFTPAKRTPPAQIMLSRARGKHVHTYLCMMR